MKRLTKIGILLVLVSMLVVYIDTLSFQTNFSSPALQVLGITPHGSRYFYFGLTNSTAVGFVYYTNGTGINYYLLNQAGFDEVYGNDTSQNSTANTLRLQGSGAIAVIYNKSAGIFPSQQNLTAAYVYQYNESPLLPAGNYYSLFQNPSASNVTVSYSLITKSPQDLQSGIIRNAAYGVTGFAMFFCGLGLIVYSVFLEKGQKSEEKEEDEVKRIYARRAPKRGRNRRRKGGKRSNGTVLKS